MSKLSLKAGTTSKLIDIFIQDSSSTTGAGLTGLVFNTVGLTAYYKIEGQSSWTSITLATMTQGTWATGGFIVGDGTHAPGMYEVGLPNACLASGKSVKIYFQGAANMVPTIVEIELTAVDNQSATAFMTSVPSVVGAVTVDLTQAVPTSNTAQTHGDCLNAARAQGFGKWTLSGTSLTLYANDGTTAVRTFTLDSSTAPTSRT